MGATLNFIETWLKLLDHNDEVRCGMYNKAMKEMFKQIPTTMTEPFRPKQKGPETYDRNLWWMVYGKITKGLPPLRIPKTIKNHKRRRIKFLYEANRYWNDRKFQLYWHNFEWVNPRSKIKRKKPPISFFNFFT